MATAPSADRSEAIASAALAWYVRTKDAGASAADHRALQEWLAADPAPARAYADMAVLWSQLAQPAAILAVEGWHRRPPRPVSVTVAVSCRIAASRKGAARAGASRPTGPANIGARPSALSAMTPPVGPLVTITAAFAPPAKAASTGARTGLASAEDQRP